MNGSKAAHFALLDLANASLICADGLLYLLCICNFIAVNVLIFVLRFDTAANVGTCLCRGVLVENVLYANSRITSFQKVQSLQALKTFSKVNDMLYMKKFESHL